MKSFLILTEPGNYYWYLTANASNGGTFAFGAAVNTAIDDYELNDTSATATAMPDKWNKIFANMDSAQDVDYYRFNAVRGQKVVIGLMDRYGLNEWLLEVFNGSGWRQLALNPHHKVDNLSAGQDVFIHVRPNPNVPINTNHDYELIFGSRIARIDQVDVGTTENLARLRHGTTNPYLSTQVHNILNWSVRISDSTGKVLPDVTVKFHVRMSLGSWANPAIFDAKVTNIGGVASGQLTPPDCNGMADPVEHTDLNNNRWLTLYNVGLWSVEVPEAIYSDYVGIGGQNVTGVTLGHICDQTLLRAGR